MSHITPRTAFQAVIVPATAAEISAGDVSNLPASVFVLNTTSGAMAQGNPSGAPFQLASTGTSLKDNLAATVGPTAANDSSAGQGYAVGSRWVNTIAKESYICVDATTGAAVWSQTTVGTISEVSGLQTALDAKATTAALTTHTGSTGNPHSVTKAQVGLGSVDNTADTAKPVSTAQQTALDAKATTTALNTGLAAKQDTLTSGTNIRTVNGASLLGAGDVAVAPDLPGGTPTTITDEGLNAGTAAVDRATIPGQTILTYPVGTSTITLPLGVTAAQVLVVAGGGGGGVGRYAGDTTGRPGGGGGAGGARSSAALTISGAQAITVGAGGDGATGTNDTDTGVAGNNGGGSSIGSLLTTVGGGRGGGHKAVQGAGWDTPASAGGSGGGGSNGGVGFAGTAGEGSTGGDGFNGTNFSGGGGGGQSAVGAAGVLAGGGQGGTGLTATISGTSRIYAAGGGGSGDSVSAGGAARSDGAVVVGAAGGSGPSGQGGDATDGRGGGGGGSTRGVSAGSNVRGGHGGDGVVIVRFPTQTRSYIGLQAFASDSAAATGGILTGEYYRDSTSGAVRQRVL